jgi:hypothetical protein
MRHATGYFGVNSAKVYRVQMGTKPAKVRLGAPGVLKCGAYTPHHTGEQTFHRANLKG